MADESGPVLVVVGDDLKRLQWLNHHVTSHWPNSRVTTFSAKQTASLARLLQESEPDAVIIQIDFAGEASASQGISQMLHLIKLRPGLYCIVLAEHGSELAAVRALKSGAADYLPVPCLTRESLLAAVSDAAAKRREAALAARSFEGGDAESETIEVPGYAIVKEIATSNFSSVYLARSERLRRNVVLKIMKRGSSTREMEDAERFQREYEIISSVSHRSIAEIHDFGTLPQHLYLAMEYFPCGDLRERLCNPVSVEEALYYLRTIAEALRVIHVFGILHRDLKPANVMLRDDNSPVLIDFGLARRAIGDSAVTGVGQVLGSPYYISPEQAQGQPVDARTDLYSLGVIFYEMLTGQKPYAGRSAVAIMAQHTNSPIPVLPPDVAQQQGLLDRLMAKDAHKRYASADELLADLAPEVETIA
jgi:eukaryotic-like serine/threonine-protein kinase